MILASKGLSHWDRKGLYSQQQQEYKRKNEAFNGGMSNTFVGGGCGSVGRAVASNTRGPRPRGSNTDTG